MVVVCFRCQGDHPPDEAGDVLLEDVQESIDDLIQLIQVYKSKNRMVRVVTSSLFKRRQEELEAAINVAVNRLQVRNTRTDSAVVGL